MHDEFEIEGYESDSALEGAEKTAQTSNEIDLSILFGFPIDINLVLLHLKQDMRDDWYFDVLQYQDLFDDINYCKTVIEQSFKVGHGVYMADVPTVRGIPKKALSERYALETDFFDRFVYQAAVTYLIKYIDPLLSHKVLSYRYEKYPLKRKYLFKNKLERWNTFEGITLTFMSSGQYLAVTDLTNFFEGISSELICDKLLTVNHLASLKVSVKCLALGATDLTSPVGQMTMTILAAVAQFERDLIRERTHAGLARARGEGRVGGRRLVLNDDQQKQILSRLENGDSVRSLARLFAVAPSTIMRIRDGLNKSAKSGLNTHGSQLLQLQK